MNYSIVLYSVLYLYLLNLNILSFHNKHHSLRGLTTMETTSGVENTTTGASPTSQ